MSEEEIAAAERELDRLRHVLEEPLSRIEASIAAGDPVPEPVRRLAANLRTALVLFDAEA